MQLLRALLAAGRGAEISRGVRPSSREAGSDQDDRIVGNRPVRLLEARDVVGRHLIVRVAIGLFRDVDDDRRSDQPLEWNAVDGLPPLREVDGGIDVRPTVL